MLSITLTKSDIQAMREVAETMRNPEYDEYDMGTFMNEGEPRIVRSLRTPHCICESGEMRIIAAGKSDGSGITLFIGNADEPHDYEVNVPLAAIF